MVIFQFIDYHTDIDSGAEPQSRAVDHWKSFSANQNMRYSWLVDYAQIYCAESSSQKLEAEPKSNYGKQEDSGKNFNEKANDGKLFAARKVPVIVTANNKHGMMSLQARSNHNYVYNPLPIRKKSKKNAVPVAAKDNRYWMLRIKNNISARKSREDRRRKEIEVIKKCDALAKENDMLKRENISLKATVSALQGLVDMPGSPSDINY